MKSTLFLNKMTVIDHGYVDHAGRVIGGSYTPDIEVTGSVTDDEHVVVDFSTCKKDIKNAIDDYLDGWDHHLLIVNGYSQYASFEQIAEDQWKLTTPACVLIAPRSMFKFIELDDASLERSVQNGHPDMLGMGNALGIELTQKLNQIYPGICIDVFMSLFCFYSEYMEFGNSVTCNFQYVHGLAQSTSLGCQRHSHGHYSFVELVDFGDDRPKTEALLFDIHRYLNNAVLIYKNNIVEEDQDTITIAYTSRAGKYFRATYNKDQNHIVVFDTETTIEHIVANVARVFNIGEKYPNIAELRISEGTQKGALIKFN